MKKINPKKIVSCASVFVAGLCGSARAEYPDYGFLWNRLVYGSDDSYEKGVVNCPIPGVYKELLKVWNKAGSDGTSKWLNFMPLWENNDKGKPKIRRGGVDFEFYAYLPQCGTALRLFSPFGGLRGVYGRDYYKRLLVDERIKRAIERCTYIVSSEVFLRRVLGDDYVDAFINECNKKEGNPTLMVKYILYPVGYQRARDTYLKEENRCPKELYKNKLDRFQPLPAGFRSRCMDHIVVDMEIYQTHQKMEGQDGKLVKVPDSKWIYRYSSGIKTFIDFQLCLKLIFDMKKEKVETVAMYDTFIVNRGISHFGKNCFNVFFGNPNKYFPSFKGRWLK